VAQHRQKLRVEACRQADALAAAQAARAELEGRLRRAEGAAGACERLASELAEARAELARVRAELADAQGAALVSRWAGCWRGLHGSPLWQSL
jgi:hypothetical protein